MKLARTAVPLGLLLLWVPFVLQTDVYPLFRFGMFAEPVRRPVQTETFVLRTLAPDGTARLVDAAETGLTSLAYLLRNYHYRRQGDTLLRRIHGLYPHRRAVCEWQLLRVVSKVARHHPDTAVVARYQPPPLP